MAESRMRQSIMRSIGSHPLWLWLVRSLISPADRLVVRLSGGRLSPPTSLVVPTLLLRVRGRLSGELRIVPLIYVRDGDAFVIGNARPESERKNPWVLNLLAAESAEIRVGGETYEVGVELLEKPDADRLWPGLVAIWPALEKFYSATGDRWVFSLAPTGN